MTLDRAGGEELGDSGGIVRGMSSRSLGGRSVGFGIRGLQCLGAGLGARVEVRVGGGVAAQWGGVRDEEVAEVEGRWVGGAVVSFN